MILEYVDFVEQGARNPRVFIAPERVCTRDHWILHRVLRAA